MDRLSVAILVSLFVFSGSGLSSALFLAYLFFGVAPIDHVTLFSLCSLLTYNFYGFIGMLYTVLCSMTLIACGLMYWFEMSVDDLKKKASEMQAKVTPNTGTDTDGQTNLINEKLKVASSYKENLLNTVWIKTGINEERRAMIKNYYVSSSKRFDEIFTIVMGFASKFRELTKDVVGLKTIYYVYDQFFVYKQGLEAFRTLHKMSRNIPTHFPQQGPVSGDVASSDDVEELDDELVPGPTSGNVRSVPTGQPDLASVFGGMGMPDMEAMQKQFDNMSPAEKKQMEDMTMNLMKNINMEDMMKMIGGIDGMIPQPRSGKRKSGKR